MGGPLLADEGGAARARRRFRRRRRSATPVPWPWRRRTARPGGRRAVPPGERPALAAARKRSAGSSRRRSTRSAPAICSGPGRGSGRSGKANPGRPGGRRDAGPDGARDRGPGVGPAGPVRVDTCAAACWRKRTRPGARSAPSIPSARGLAQAESAARPAEATEHVAESAGRGGASDAPGAGARRPSSRFRRRRGAPVTAQQRKEIEDLYARGLAAMQAERNAEALRYWELVYSIDPDYQQVRDHLKREYLMVGMDSFADGRLEEAAGYWQKALQVDPERREDQRAISPAPNSSSAARGRSWGAGASRAPEHRTPAIRSRRPWSAERKARGKRMNERTDPKHREGEADPRHPAHRDLRGRGDHGGGRSGRRRRCRNATRARRSRRRSPCACSWRRATWP